MASITKNFKIALTEVFGERGKEFSPELLKVLRVFYERAQKDARRELEPQHDTHVECEQMLHAQDAKFRGTLARCADLVTHLHDVAESSDHVSEDLRRLLWQAMEEFR